MSSTALKFSTRYSSAGRLTCHRKRPSRSWTRPASTGSVSGSTSSTASRMYATARSKRPDICGDVARVPQQAHVAHAGERGRVGHLIPQRQRGFGVLQRLRVRVHLLGRARGLQRGRQRAPLVVGRRPVADELARELRRVTVVPIGFALELVGDRDVEPHALAREEILVDGLVHERVPEAVREAVGLGDEHLVRDRVAQALVQLGFRDVGDRGHEPVVGGPADDRQRPAARAARVRRARRRARARCRATSRAACRRRAPRRRGAPRRRTRCRPSVRTSRATRSGVRHITADRGDQLRDLVAVEAGQVDARDGARAFELGEHRPQRVPPVQVVGAERPDDEHARVAQVAGEEHEEVAGRVIGPVQVLEERAASGCGRRGG